MAKSSLCRPMLPANDGGLVRLASLRLSWPFTLDLDRDPLSPRKVTTCHKSTFWSCLRPLLHQREGTCVGSVVQSMDQKKLVEINLLKITQMREVVLDPYIHIKNSTIINICRQRTNFTRLWESKIEWYICMFLYTYDRSTQFDHFVLHMPVSTIRQWKHLHLIIHSKQSRIQWYGEPLVLTQHGFPLVSWVLFCFLDESVS